MSDYHSDGRRLYRRLIFICACLWLAAHAGATAFGNWNLLIALAIWDGIFVAFAALWWISGKVFRS